ncbi:26S proteasome regulatory subunit rpn9 [Ceratobasidium sp. AG-Ba]|nr:26S proteasome regulatory subunit rpn9 [Ceratobasidium sp. AG-Ba]
MSAMQVDSKLDVDSYLATTASSVPSDLHPFFEKFKRFHQRKLWHQLTLVLFEFLEHPQSGPFQVDLFTKFVRDFEDKMNQLQLVSMGVRVSKQLDDPNAILTFLTSLLERIDKEKSREAWIMLVSSIAHTKLIFGDLAGTKVDMDECQKLLDDLDGVEPSVHAAYYEVAADYYKAKADYVPYYKNSLLYLACVDVQTDLTSDQRLVRAHDLSIAALLGETIYNFGELLQHPILDSLAGTPHEWLKNLLFVFNEGNIGKFESAIPLFPQEPILEENHPFLRQKICLMALIESVFKRMGTGSAGKTMSFQTIAEETRLPQDEVEHLVMKALSLKLIQGTLDQVSETANITWVQPRVLSRPQLAQLAARLDEWCDRIDALDSFVQLQTPELFAH